MSTNSVVIVKVEKKYKGIHCQWDGDFEGVGATLHKNFNSKTSALAIVALGDCSIIASCVRINPIGHHGFSDNEREDGTILAYHRDRNEPWNSVKPVSGRTISEVANKFSGSYVYVWENEEWNFYKKIDGKIEKALTSELKSAILLT